MNSVPAEGKELAAGMVGVFGFVHPNLDYALGSEPAVSKVNGFANHQRSSVGCVLWRNVSKLK